MINHGVSPCYIDGTQPVLPASLPRKVLGMSSQPLRPVPLLHILQSCPQTRMPAKPLQRPLQAVHFTMLLHVDQASSLIAPASSSSLGWCIPEPVPSTPHITPTSTNRGPTHLWTIPLQLQATSQQHAGAVVVAAFHIQQIQQLCWLLLTIIAYYSHD